VPFGDIEAARAAIDEHVGAVILEPIQALAGVVEAQRSFLAAVGAACDAHGAYLIFDEVQTGNGRLGTPWAAQHYGILPDAFTTAKGAAGGLPIGITVVAQALAERLPEKLFGSTFGGGPTVLSAATEVNERIAAPGFLEGVQAVSALLRAAAHVSPIAAVRGQGLLLGFELEEGLAARDARDALLAEGVLVGLSSDPRVLRITPPLTLEPADVERFGAALRALPHLLGATA
jgi:acetylornithine/succinyldiaminopimelate/putrescine aminotransferase